MMRVTYVTMQSPATSETFASSNVAALRRLGVDVRVVGMRPPHTDHERMLAERGLQDVPIRPMTPARYATSTLLAVRHPVRTWTLLHWAFRWHWLRLHVLLRCLALLPSAQAVFASLRAQDPEIVHLFWAHYPSMVAILLMRYSPQTPRTVFLGAYDLDEGRYGSILEGSVSVARAADVVWNTKEREELVLEGQTKYRVPVSDVETAAERLAWLLDDDMSREANAVEARRHVELHFTVDASMWAYVDVWKDVLVRREGGIPCAES